MAVSSKLLYVASFVSSLFFFLQLPELKSSSTVRYRPYHSDVGTQILHFQNSTEDLMDPIQGPLACRPTPTLCRPSDIVVTFFDLAHLDYLSIWLHYYKRFDNSQRILCLIALSEDAYFRLEKEISTFERLGRIIIVQADQGKENNRNTWARNDIWAFRVKMLNKFLQLFPSLNVILSDLDALWLQDPQSLFCESGSSDDCNSTYVNIVASQGTFPAHCCLLCQSEKKNRLGGPDHYGGRAVFGFIYFRNSLLTQVFAGGLAREASLVAQYDDQVALNCQLHNHYNLSSSLLLADGSFLLQYHSSTSATFAVKILSNKQVVRNCVKYRHSIKNATVVHCWGGYKSDGLDVFARHGLLPANFKRFHGEPMF